MNRKLFMLLPAILMGFVCSANVTGEGMKTLTAAAETPQEPKAVAPSSTAVPQDTRKVFALRICIGALNMVNLGEESLHPACGMTATFDIFSTSQLSLALGSEIWTTFGSYQDGDLETIPILAGVRASLFPSNPLRLYGTGCAGVCISKYTVSETTWVPPFFFEETNKTEETDSSFAYEIGGGAELVFGGRSFSIDYRYLVVPADAKLGGHLLCVSYGFHF
jgi:hypothetical protein